MLTLLLCFWSFQAQFCPVMSCDVSYMHWLQKLLHISYCYCPFLTENMFFHFYSLQPVHPLKLLNVCFPLNSECCFHSFSTNSLSNLWPLCICFPVVLIYCRKHSLPCSWTHPETLWIKVSARCLKCKCYCGCNLTRPVGPCCWLAMRGSLFGVMWSAEEVWLPAGREEGLWLAQTSGIDVKLPCVPSSRADGEGGNKNLITLSLENERETGPLLFIDNGLKSLQQRHTEIAVVFFSFILVDCITLHTCLHWRSFIWQIGQSIRSITSCLKHQTLCLTKIKTWKAPRFHIALMAPFIAGVVNLLLLHLSG